MCLNRPTDQQTCWVLRAAKNENTQRQRIFWVHLFHGQCRAVWVGWFRFDLVKGDKSRKCLKEQFDFQTPLHSWLPRQPPYIWCLLTEVLRIFALFPLHPVHTPHCPMHIKHCPVHCPVHSPHYPVHSVHWPVHTRHSIVQFSAVLSWMCAGTVSPGKNTAACPSF